MIISVTVVAKLGLLPNASAISFSVSNVPGAPPIRSFIYCVT
nr:MAG TPA: hypothetical protein [Caudoviricetes sp.]